MQLKTAITTGSGLQKKKKGCFPNTLPMQYITCSHISCQRVQAIASRALQGKTNKGRLRPITAIKRAESKYLHVILKRLPLKSHTHLNMEDLRLNWTMSCNFHVGLNRTYFTDVFCAKPSKNAKEKLCNT